MTEKTKILFVFNVSRKYVASLIARFQAGCDVSSVTGKDYRQLFQGKVILPKSDLKTSLVSLYKGLLADSFFVSSIQIKKSPDFKVCVVLSNARGVHDQVMTKEDLKMLDELFNDSLWFAVGYENKDVEGFGDDPRQLFSLNLVARRLKNKNKEAIRKIVFGHVGPKMAFSESIEEYTGG